MPPVLFWLLSERGPRGHFKSYILAIEQEEPEDQEIPMAMDEVKKGYDKYQEQRRVQRQNGKMSSKKFIKQAIMKTQLNFVSVKTLSSTHLPQRS